VNPSDPPAPAAQPDVADVADRDLAPEHESSALRGSFVAVIAMAVFFCVVWFSVLALLLERR
jgi:hypothetical protein